LTDVLTQGAADYAGNRCVYRLGFIAMELPDLPARLQVGRVVFARGIGPVITQRTSVVQRPGDELIFEKMLDPFVSVGDALPLTMLEIDDTLPNESVDQAIDRWYAEAVGAAGLVSALLDERLFQRPALEDLLIFDDEGREVIGAADARMRLRHFLPYPISELELEALDQLGEAYRPDSPESAAARWYLRAAQAGPLADSVVFLWIAIDALLGTDGERVVPALHDRFDELGIDLTPLPITPGRLYGLRGDVVHGGKEQPPGLREGFYVLETLTRTLLRAALDVESLWPFQVGQRWSPLKDMHALDASWANPQVKLSKRQRDGEP
jgi:hypothetical protein